MHWTHTKIEQIVKATPPTRQPATIAARFFFTWLLVLLWLRFISDTFKSCIPSLEISKVSNAVVSGEEDGDDVLSFRVVSLPGPAPLTAEILIS